MPSSMNLTADKWDKIYASCELSTPAEPCWLLRHHSRYLPLRGHALELGSGLAGNARFMARCGLNTQAWDVSEVATGLVNKWARAQGLNQLQAYAVELNPQVLAQQQFDVIVVSRFLDRTLSQAIESALKPRGVVFYQTFLSPVQDNAPQNPDFYIHPNEYQAWWPNLRCELYGEGRLIEEGKEATSRRYGWYIGRKI